MYSKPPSGSPDSPWFEFPARDPLDADCCSRSADEKRGKFSVTGNL
jgi:hypothetical protein